MVHEVFVRILDVLLQSPTEALPHDLTEPLFRTSTERAERTHPRVVESDLFEFRTIASKTPTTFVLCAPYSLPVPSQQTTMFLPIIASFFSWFPTRPSGFRAVAAHSCTRANSQRATPLRGDWLTRLYKRACNAANKEWRLTRSPHLAPFPRVIRRSNWTPIGRLAY